MQASNGTAPTYRLHKPTGKAVVTIDGKCFYLGPYDSPESKAEYARRIAEYARTGSTTNTSGGSGGIMVTELLARFNRHANTWYHKNGKLTNEYDAYRVLMRKRVRQMRKAMVEVDPQASWRGRESGTIRIPISWVGRATG